MKILFIESANMNYLVLDLKDGIKRYHVKVAQLYVDFWNSKGGMK